MQMDINADRTGSRFSAASSPVGYLAAIGVVIATVGLAFLVNRLMPHTSLSLLFLTGVVIVSALTGLGPSLLASVLSFLAFNFFFTPPYHTFEVADEGDVATLVLFLLMAAITGNLAARMHHEMAQRRASLQRMSNLYEFSRRVSSAAGTEAVQEALASHLEKSLGTPVAVLEVDSEGCVRVLAGRGYPEMLHRIDSGSLEFRAARDPIVVDAWNFLRMNTNQKHQAYVALYGRIDTGQLNLVRSLCDQAAVALDRTRLVADLEQARLVSETEQLRSALLSSVSHDLRTPLASIIGSTTSLLEYGESFSPENRHELLATIDGEAQRLDRHIQNLLDMTRLGQGGLTLQRDWVDLHDIVASAVNRLRDILKGLVVSIEIGDSVPLLWVHGVLVEQALVNLLDNAARFSPPGGHIVIAARADADRVRVDLCDDGPGVPEHEREKIFDMFYTLRQGDRGGMSGTGLGLAICRGMVAAHGGSVSAHEGANGQGACMRILLPIVRPEGG